MNNNDFENLVFGTERVNPDGSKTQKYITETVEAFLNLSYAELAAGESRNYQYSNCVIPILLTINGIDRGHASKEEIAQRVKVKDIIRMIDDVKYNPDYGDDLCSPVKFFYFECRNFANILSDTMRSVIPVKLFMNLTLRQFFKYVSVKAQEQSYDEETVQRSKDRLIYDLERIFKMAKKPFSDDTTIREAIQALQNVGRKCWLPEMNSIAQYEDMIMTVHRCFEALLIRSLMYVNKKGEKENG